MLKRHRATLAILLALAFSALARSAPPTLDEILSSPFPSWLTAAPRSPKVAWVFNDRGGRDIWVAEGPDYSGRPVTELTSDDGQVITSLTWSPSGRRIAFVRGGSANAGGELPNPKMDPQGVEQAVYVLSLSEDETRRIDDGRAPLFSADGQTLLYLKKGKIWTAPLSRSRRGISAESALLIDGRGSFDSLELSPDGSRLAFVSSRGVYSFVGVYDFRHRTLRYLDPGVDRDISPVWSPDSSSVAFVRLPARLGTRIFGPVPEGPPWSIRIADASPTSEFEGIEVWRAEAGAGSVFRAVVADQQLFWTSDNHLVFPWELDGWTHLYALPLNGGAPRLLTPGAFEVESVALTPDRSSVVYSSNEGDIDRRHLWSVGARGGRPTQLTRGDGIEHGPTPIIDGAIAFLSSNGTRPLQPTILQGEEVRRLAPALVARGFPRQGLVEPRQVLFPAADGLQIHGQLFEPPAEFSGPRPAILFFHGGSRRQMLLGWHYSSYYHNCYAFNQYMASRGFVVLAVNYRSGIGYGLAFREAEGYGATGASEFQDVLGAGLYLRGLENVDPSNIGLWGGSYGGYLTALGLSRASHLFAAGVDIHGVHDWRRTIKNFAPDYNPLADPDAARLAFESSPLATVDTWRSPVLLIHGDDDRNVPFLETVELVEKLRERDVEVELLVFPDEVHGFLTHDHWLEAFRRASEFFERHLGRVRL